MTIFIKNIYTMRVTELLSSAILNTLETIEFTPIMFLTITALYSKMALWKGKSTYEIEKYYVQDLQPYIPLNDEGEMPLSVSFQN
ncbi:hypothetical protein Xkoz_02967 [Xenorhabdus kozodoii]|uniref:Uncharacterized protein n=1 Tax=Xenorhabdus kozodoii TaxID=351676 RepID=A0A2D0L5I6_9GAMM|nr:hypothetical protein Xkoz_02967 [Xenorhabdus kozodoii]